MAYDDWKLRSDMDDDAMSSNAMGRGRWQEPRNRTCNGPCVRCDDIAVSTQEINGERCCELHAECAVCGVTLDEPEMHMQRGEVFCAAHYNNQGLDDPYDAKEER